MVFNIDMKRKVRLLQYLVTSGKNPILGVHEGSFELLPHFLEDEVLPNTFDFCNSTKLSGAWRGGLLGTFGDVGGVLALALMSL